MIIISVQVIKPPCEVPSDHLLMKNLRVEQQQLQQLKQLLAFFRTILIFEYSDSPQSPHCLVNMYMWDHLLYFVYLS